MLASENNRPPQDKPTGSLEELFRHKFAEAEVAPPASLWDQLDHDLLVQQNTTLQRRLQLHRWVAAASVLLMLAGGGSWFALHDAPDSAGYASLRTNPATASGTAATNGANSASARYSDEASASVTDYANSLNAAAASEMEAYRQSGNQATTAHTANTLSGASYAAGSLAGSTTSVTTAGRSYAHGSPSVFAGDYYLTNAASVDPSSFYFAGSRSGLSHSVAAGSQQQALLNQLSLRQASALRSLMANLPPDSLKPALVQTPVFLAVAATEKAEDRPKLASKIRQWRLRTSYSGSAYNPNINFGRSEQTAGLASAASNQAPLSMAPGSRAFGAYEDAAAEYRQNLRAGLGQRLSVGAEYNFNERWSLVTGAEIGQQEARSATSYASLGSIGTAFTGADMQSPLNNYTQMRTTRYRYRTASIPVAVRYTTAAAKSGWALYAKVGAAVSGLLSSRTEIEGESGSDRTYHYADANSPYRKVLTSLRGGGGVRFQPATASWSLAVGPEAEAGLSTLNVDPAQTFLRRSRPYSLGVEASVDFGAARPAVVNP